MPNLLSEFSDADLAEEVSKRRGIKGWLSLVSAALFEAEKCIALIGDDEGGCALSFGGDEFDAADLSRFLNPANLFRPHLEEFAKGCAHLRKELTAAIERLGGPAG
jgi:hypothetical protein